ncbi:MAG: hypothetical protein Ct9H300mP15_08530 [Gemmatimonadota bacterium]|nr:MAG: hypothetical protein Ct9H300mP15_08530 [Gemmatimonadota bacterium]
MNEAVSVLVDGTDELEAKEHPPLLAEAARIADRGKAFEQRCLYKNPRLIYEYPEAPELGDAVLKHWHATERAHPMGLNRQLPS